MSGLQEDLLRGLTRAVQALPYVPEGKAPAE
jgi:hypothetical protein